MKELVLLGGGHSHVEVLRDWGHRRQKAQNQRHQPLLMTGSDNLRPAPAPSPPLPKPLRTTSGGRQPSQPSQQPQQQQQNPSNDAPAPAANLTLISRGRFTPYSGMLPGWAAGFYSYDECHIDLQRLAEYAGARLVLAAATGIDIQARRVHLGDAVPAVPYDVLSVDVGITPGSAGVPGAGEHATPVKPIDGFARRYEQLLARYRNAAAAADDGGLAAAAAHPLRVVVVGGGAGGVELAAAVRFRLQQEASRRRGVGTSTGEPGGARGAAGGGGGGGGFLVSLVCRGPLLPGHPNHVRRLVRRLLGERGVEVREGAAVVGVTKGSLQLQTGTTLPYDECLWCTQAAPAAWLRSTGLPTDDKGFLLISDMLQSDGGPPEVFAAGDVATSRTHPRPKAGVYAVRQGPPLAANLRRFLSGEPLQPFVPQETAMALISLGDRFCVISRTGGASRCPGARRRTQQQPPGGGAAGRAGGPSDADGGVAAEEGDQGPSDREPGPDAEEEEEEDGREWPVGWLLNGFGGRLIGLTGPLLWRWKDAIDRAFMRRYSGALGGRSKDRNA